MNFTNSAGIGIAMAAVKEHTVSFTLNIAIQIYLGHFRIWKVAL